MKLLKKVIETLFNTFLVGMTAACFAAGGLTALGVSLTSALTIATCMLFGTLFMIFFLTSILGSDDEIS